MNRNNIEFEERTLAKQWVNSSVFNMPVSVSHFPFLYSIVDNFFNISKLDYIREICDQIDPKYFSKHLGNAYKYAVCPSKKLLDLIKDNEFISLLKKITGVKLKPCQAFPYPQYYLFDQEKKHIKIHNDFDKSVARRYATLIYIHEDWIPSYGGCLQLHTNDENKSITKIIEPIPNRLFFFEISSISYHSVQKPKRDWTRKTIVIDWDKED